jgi:hypothetical protein
LKKNKKMNNCALRFYWSCCFSGMLFCLGSADTLAQSPCQADALVQRNFKRIPELMTLRQDYLDRMANTPTQAQGRTVVSISVVVHVVYKSNLENISDSQIFSQLEILNADYRLLNENASATPTLFTPLAADMEVEFCLAGTDPDGNPTSGIVRRETPWNNIGQLTAPDGRPRIHYTELGGNDAWSPEHYLNIWVCSIGGGILGFGAYPGTAPPAEDGVVIDPRYFGTTGLAAFNAPHHLGRTATHEIGHYFNLFHIWGEDEFSCNDDDDVEDTPTQRGPYLGCPVFPQLSCGNSAMFMNFMDYTNDACMTLFTAGQKVRLWATLNSVRAGLMDGVGCSTTAAHSLPSQGAKLHISPNPVGEMLAVEIENLRPGGMLRIFDLTGKLWLATPVGPGSKAKQIDVSGLPAGVFQLQIFSETNSRFGLFVKI